MAEIIDSRSQRDTGNLDRGSASVCTGRRNGLGAGGSLSRSQPEAGNEGMGSQKSIYQ